MFQLIGLLLWSVTCTLSADPEPNVVALKKLVDIQHLSVKEFCKLNKAHVIETFLEDKTGLKDNKNTFNDLQYAGKINIGHPEQTLNVFFDTNSADLLVLSAAHCKSLIMKLVSSTCSLHSYYDETNSIGDQTYVWKQAMYPYLKLSYGNGIMNGLLVFDKVKVGNMSPSPSLFGIISQWDYAFPYAKADGVLGLGPKSLTKFIKDKTVNHIHPDDEGRLTTYRPVLKQLSELGISKIGFHLYKDKKGNEVGQLILGADDGPGRGKTNLEWISRVEGGHTPYWTLPLTKIKFIEMSSGEIEAVSYDGHYSIPDPGTSVFAGPPALIDEIHKQLFRNIEKVKRSTQYGTVQFDCRYQDQLPILVFEMNGKGYNLDPKDYVKRLRSKCTTGFLAVQSLTVLVMGDPFFRRYYTVLDNPGARMGFAESVSPQ